VLDPAADRDLFQINAETGMALLPAGLPVVSVVDAQDREVGRVDHRDAGKRTDVHQELAVAGHDEHAFLRPREREAEPHHARRAHGACERIDMRAIPGDRADIAGRPAQAGDDEKVFMPADE
jgi:hypothetical protein